MKKIKMLFKTAIIITIVLALVLPTTAFVTNREVIHKENIDEMRHTTIKECKKLLRPQYAIAGDNILVSGQDDDILPSICFDPYGNTIVTYTIQPNPLEGSMGISWSNTPANPNSWDGWKIDLEDSFSMFFDTAKVEGPEPNYFKGLMGVYMAMDQEEAGFYTIEDIYADPEGSDDWIFSTWQDGAPEPEYACISDMGSYLNIHEPEIIGPFNFFINREIYQQYDIPGCPICFQTGIESGSGMSFFDGQAFEATAPASNPDIVDLGDRFHTIIQYNDPQGPPKIVWKKIVPYEEPDYEFTPYQDTIANGTNPSIAAYNTSRGVHVAVAYVDSYEVKCMYSTNDGENWNNSTIGTGTFPDIYASGGNLYCAYINAGNLLYSSSEDGGETWSSPEQINNEQGSVHEVNNSVDLHKAGVVWVDTRGSDLDIYWSLVEMGNEPNAPEINGPNSGKVKASYTYKFNSTDPDGDKVSYFIDWGDGNTTGWTGFKDSGTTYSTTHKWLTNGTYTIKAKAKDIFNNESDWSEPLIVTIEENIKSPVIRIIQPERGLYIFGKKILPRFIRLTKIIGSITIEVNVTDEDSEIEKVEFYINGWYMGNDTSEPYTYDWGWTRPRLIHLFIVTIKAYDISGNEAIKRMIVRKFL